MMGSKSETHSPGESAFTISSTAFNRRTSSASVHELRVRDLRCGSGHNIDLSNIEGGEEEEEKEDGELVIARWFLQPLVELV